MIAGRVPLETAVAFIRGEEAEIGNDNRAVASFPKVAQIIEQTDADIASQIRS